MNLSPTGSGLKQLCTMPLKRYKPWKLVSDKRRAAGPTHGRQHERDHQFYTEIWEERGGICQVSGDYLGAEPLTTMFHHILPKAKFPQYRYCSWNIILIHPDLHAQVERDMDKVPAVKVMYQDLLEKHLRGELS